MNKNDAKVTSLRGLRFLFSKKSVIGLLVANLITLIPFLCGVVLVPLLDAGTDVGAGIIQPFSYDALWGMAQFGGIASLLGTLLLAAPVICYLGSRDRTSYADYTSTLLVWVAGVCLLASFMAVLLTQNIASIMAVFLFFPIVWVPAWMACAAYWLVAVKEPQHIVKTSSMVMFVLALLLWFFMSINFGAFIATD